VNEHPSLRFESRPTLRRPHLVLAWAGWNDAGEAASTAARYLAATLDAQPFATIDPEEFYDFTEARPLARYRRGKREIMWPSTDFYAAELPQSEQDLILGVGIEPNFRWKGYMDAVRAVIESMDVGMVVTLGAVAAGVPHTQPVGVSGSANAPELAKRFKMRPSRYEGPTGIVGVFHDDCRQHGVDGLSLWAAVPHYLPGIANPLGARALLERVETICGIPIDYEHLHLEERRFDRQVKAAMEESDDLSAYVQQLEQTVATEDAPPRPPELPPAEVLIEDLEEYLRRSRDESS
jgi:predicted ATP-grasp superfamily ATP-dependent carboligase